MTGRKAAVKEFEQIDLTAIEGDQRKILIVDMNKIIAVGVDEALGQDVIIDEKLCALGAELEHDAHRRVCIDIGVVAFKINVLGVGEEDIAIDFHQIFLSLAPTCMFFAIDDELFRDIEEAVLHKGFLDDVLNFLDADRIGVGDGAFDGARHDLEIII